VGGWAWGRAAARTWFWHGLKLLAFAACVGAAVESVVSSLGFATHEVLASEHRANVAAISSVTRSEPWTGGWVVTHDTFRLLSATAYDSERTTRFDATWESCRVAGTAVPYCPPPPVWIVELTTFGPSSYRLWTTHRYWVVEVNAITGQVIDSKPRA
jgi:hypothetical protein